MASDGSPQAGRGFAPAGIRGEQTGLRPPTKSRDARTSRGSPPDTPTVSYCELVRDYQRYKDKVVRVHAQYRIGFEISYLYDVECVKSKTALEQAAARQETWLGFDAAHQSCWQPAVAKLHETRGGRGVTAEVTVVGKFYGPENRRGPTPGGKHQFVTPCVERAKIIADDRR